MANPYTAQGVLNRLRVHVIVPGYTELNISPSNMGKNFVTAGPDGDFNNLIPTATGAVSSPEPYVLYTAQIDLLRTQALATAWWNQSKNYSTIGNVSLFPDSSAFPEIDLVNCIIKHIDPGPYNGMGPDVKLTIHGVWYVNNDLWSM